MLQLWTRDALGVRQTRAAASPARLLLRLHEEELHDVVEAATAQLQREEEGTDGWDGGWPQGCLSG